MTNEQIISRCQHCGNTKKQHNPRKPYRCATHLTELLGSCFTPWTVEEYEEATAAHRARLCKPQEAAPVTIPVMPVAAQEAPRAFDLTPNYGVIFKQFAKDAANAGEYLSAGICGAQFDEYPEEPQEVARRAAVLRAVQAYLAPVTIALQCATSVAEVEQVREVMAETLKRVDTWAAEFEGLSETGEEE